MLYEEDRRWIASFGASHPELFTLLRAAGWVPGQTGPERATNWSERALHFNLNRYALNILLELGGIVLEFAPPGARVHRFTFAPGTAFDNLVAVAPDYTLDIATILSSEQAFPVGEGGGKVLFVNERKQASFIDQSLCGFVRAPDPFVLLDWFLLQKTSPHIEHRAVHQGARIADLL